MDSGSEDQNDSSNLNDSQTSDLGQESDSIVQTPVRDDDKDPVRILQLSQPFFVADTLDDDESVVIPPTPEPSIPYMIPSTPTNNHDVSTNAICFPESPKGASNDDEMVIPDTELPGDISEIVCDEECAKDDDEKSKSPSKLSADATKEPKEQLDELEKEFYGTNGNRESDSEDWHIRLTPTQPTQGIMETADIYEKQTEPFKVHLVSKSEECSEVKKIEEKKDGSQVQREESTEKTCDDTVLEVIAKDDEESEDEVEPSQSNTSQHKLESTSLATSQTQDTQLIAKETIPKDVEISEINGKAGVDELANPSTSVDDPKTMVEDSETEMDISSESQLNPDAKANGFKNISETSGSNVESQINGSKSPVKNTEQITVDETMSERATENEEMLSVDKNSDNTNLMDTSEDKDKQADSSVLEKSQKETLPIISSQSAILIGTTEDNEKQTDNSICGTEKSQAENLPAVTSQSEIENVKEHELSETLVPPNPVKKSSTSSTMDNAEEPDHHFSVLPQSTSLFSRSLARRLGAAKRKSHESTNTSSSEKSETHEKLIGTFSDIESLEKLFSPYSISLEHEQLDKICTLKSREEAVVTVRFIMKDSKMFMEEHITVETQHTNATHDATSPHSGSSSNPSVKASSGSLHSGEMGDISSSLSSSKSGYVSDGHPMERSHESSKDMSFQEEFKTSTQVSQPIHRNFQSAVVDIFGAGQIESELAEDDTSKAHLKKSLSPIVPYSTSTPSMKRKKESTTTTTDESPAATRSRGRTTRATKQRKVDKSAIDKSSSSNEAVPENVPRKRGRKKKLEIQTPIIEETMVTSEAKAENKCEIVADESNFGSIAPGVRVMARWTDGYYYPGIVRGEECEGRWSVLFDDGATRPINHENLLKIAVLELGTSVLVLSQDGYYDPGTICGHYKEKEKSGVNYEVEMESGATRRYPRTSVILTTEQAKLISSKRPPTTPATMTINLDNIVEGKRKRKSAQSPAVSASAKKKSLNVTEEKRKADSNLDTSSADKNSESDQSSTNETRRQRVSKTKTVPAKQSKVSTTKNTRFADKNRSNSAVMETRQKLFSDKTKNVLFKDYAFLLSNAERKVGPSKFTDSDFDGEQVEDEEGESEDEDCPIPFNREDIAEIIEWSGGIILENFEEVKDCTRKHIFLLANSYLRTIKYLQCIAGGIRCITHVWVYNSSTNGQVEDVKAYFLPCGYSIVTKKIVEWHGKKDVLKGMSAAVIADKKSDFVSVWTPVLLAAKMDVVQKWNLPTAQQSGPAVVIDVLITNSTCPQTVLASARKRKIPILSSEWIIQSLISGKRLPYDDHPKFKHNASQ